MRTLWASLKGVRMAKAIFQKNQRVWVESVGAWAVLEKLVPVWARGFDEPPLPGRLRLDGAAHRR